MTSYAKELAVKIQELGLKLKYRVCYQICNDAILPDNAAVE